jgi:N-acetylmuramoyl-L-alanine amidase
MKKLGILNIAIIVTLILLTGCSNNVGRVTQGEKLEVKEDKSVTSTSVNVGPAVTTIAPPTLKTEVKKPVEPISSSAEIKEKSVNEKPVVQVQGGNKIIVIDPGHANRSNLEKEALAPGSSEMKIKDGGGAQGIATKTPEYVVNMQVAMKLKVLLEGNGFKVIMTKTDNSLSLGNIDRANIGNNANANLVIRIHADSNDNSSVIGASMLVPAAMNENTKAIHDESKRCGTIILNTLASEVGMKNRGVVEHSDMTGFNWSKVPVILVEMGFLSNANEDNLLSSDGYENKLALGLFHGILIAEK